MCCIFSTLCMTEHVPIPFWLLMFMYLCWLALDVSSLSYLKSPFTKSSFICYYAAPPPINTITSQHNVDFMPWYEPPHVLCFSVISNSIWVSLEKTGFEKPHVTPTVAGAYTTNYLGAKTCMTTKLLGIVSSTCWLFCHLPYHVVVMVTMITSIKPIIVSNLKRSPLQFEVLIWHWNARSRVCLRKAMTREDDYQVLHNLMICLYHYLYNSIFKQIWCRNNMVPSGWTLGVKAVLYLVRSGGRRSFIYIVTSFYRNFLGSIWQITYCPSTCCPEFWTK